MLRTDAASKPRYRHERKTDKFISGATYASKLETAKITRNYISAKKAELVELGSLFHQQKMTAADFRVAAAQTLKSIHIANATLGKDKLTHSDMATITEILEQQFYSGKGKDGKPFGLKLLIDDVLKGKVSEPQLRNRLRMYGESGQVSFSAMGRGKAIASGMLYARRIRVQDERSCKECIAYESLGYVPINQLILPGTLCSCRSNCRCVIEYR